MTVRSQNGWPANDITRTDVQLIPGTSVRVRLVKGPAGELLRWVASQIDKRVENIDGPVRDDWGYAERTVRGGTDLSNHASGTALDIDALKHVLGTDPRASFTAEQVAEIHRILAEAGHLVRWGGDYVGRRDPMHFEINDGVSAADCAARLDSLTLHNHTEDDMPLSDADIKRIWGYHRSGADDDASQLLQDMHDRVMRYLNAGVADALAAAKAALKAAISASSESVATNNMLSDVTGQLRAVVAKLEGIDPAAAGVDRATPDTTG
jgi:hypothetical protein